jgi:hypothetical protein
VASIAGRGAGSPASAGPATAGASFAHQLTGGPSRPRAAPWRARAHRRSDPAEVSASPLGARGGASARRRTGRPAGNAERILACNFGRASLAIAGRRLQRETPGRNSIAFVTFMAIAMIANVAEAGKHAGIDRALPVEQPLSAAELDSMRRTQRKAAQGDDLICGSLDG